MKNRRLLALLLICSALLVGCTSEPYLGNDSKKTGDEQTEKDSQKDKDKTNSSDETSKTNEATDDRLASFEQLIKDSEYASAIEYFNSTLSGNYELEVGAQDVLIDICNDINDKVLSGEYDEKTAKTNLGVIDKVVDGTQVSPKGYDEVVAKIDGSLESKAAFDAAMTFESLSNYGDALQRYQMVITNDSNYLEAQNGIERCISTIRQNALDSAQTYADQSNYIESIREINSAISYISDDVSLTAALDVYETQYVKQILDTVDKLKSESNFAQVIPTLNEARNILPYNKELEQAYPILIDNCLLLNSSGFNTNQKEREDSLGKTYYECSTVFSICDGGYAEYSIKDTNVSCVSFSLAPIHFYESSRTGSLTILADDKIVYTSPIISQKTEKFDVKVDIPQSTKFIRLEFDANAYGYSDVLIIDMFLWS